MMRKLLEIRIGFIIIINNNSNIYKISITIGFIGVILHFLLIKSNNNNNNTGSNF